MPLSKSSYRDKFMTQTKLSNYSSLKPWSDLTVLKLARNANTDNKGKLFVMLFA